MIFKFINNEVKIFFSDVVETANGETVLVENENSVEKNDTGIIKEEAKQEYFFIMDNTAGTIWSGLVMNMNAYIDPSTFDGYVDTLIVNGFTELRISLAKYSDDGRFAESKDQAIRASAKGVKVIWGISGYWNDTITSDNWPTLRQAILDAATWAQTNGVYEFQLGNEMEFFNDDTTLTDAQLIENLKSVATEVQTIFTRGNISYALNDSNIPDWISAGKGDIDLLGANLYQGGDTFNDNWKTLLTNFVTEFGSSAYLSEFNLSYTSLDSYSTDEEVQAAAVAEMIDYIKASGIERAIFFVFQDNRLGIIRDDGTYRRLIWDTLTSTETSEVE